MGLKQTDEFRQDAVRIALTSGLTRKIGALNQQISVGKNQKEPSTETLARL